jgi:replication factor C subunit 1
MDIRMFFTQKGDKNGKKPAKKEAEKKKEVVVEKKKVLAEKKKVVEKKKEVLEKKKEVVKKKEVLEKKIEVLEKKNEAVTEKTSRKKKIIIDDSDDDDDDDDDYTAEASPSPPPAKKLKAQAKVEEARVEVSASSFFGGTKAIDKKAKAVDLTKDDEKAIDLTKDAKKSPVKKTPTATNSPSKRPIALDANNQKKPSSSNKKPRRAASKPPPRIVLKPTLTQDSFNVDDETAAECLSGYTFVFTGILEGLSRDDGSDFVKTLGGRVTTTVSSKTDYLVAGLILEDGRPYQEGSKYKRAKEEGTHVLLGISALYGLAQQYHDQQKQNNTTTDTKPATKTEAPTAAVDAPPAAAPVNPYAKSRSSAVSNPYARANPYATTKPPPTPDQKPASSKTKNKPAELNMLWVDKYKPKHSREILGNQDAVRKLGLWLNSWEDKFLNTNAIGKSFAAPNGPWKAALLSGPPGIGSELLCIMCCVELS